MPSLLSRLRAHLAAPLLAPVNAELDRTRALLCVTRSDLADARLDLTHAEALLAAVPVVVEPVGVSRAPVSAPRRADILGTVEWFGTVYDLDPTANEIAASMCGRYNYADNRTTIARWVSALAAEGWLHGRPVKPMRYTLTEMGRSALAGDVAVGS